MDNNKNPFLKSQLLYGGLGFVLLLCLAIIGTTVFAPPAGQTPNPTPTGSITDYVYNVEEGLIVNSSTSPIYQVTGDAESTALKLKNVFKVEGELVDGTIGDEVLFEYGVISEAAPDKHNDNEKTPIDERLPYIYVYGSKDAGFYTWDYYDASNVGFGDSEPSNQNVVEREVKRVMKELGYAETEYEATIDGDYVRIVILLNGEETPFFFVFNFSNDKLYSARGYVLDFVNLGDKEVLGLDSVLERIGDYYWMGFPTLSTYESIYGAYPTTISGELIVFTEPTDKKIVDAELVWLMAKLESGEVRMVRGYGVSNAEGMFAIVVATELD
jgi:hypothetical protein